MNQVVYTCTGRVQTDRINLQNVPQRGKWETIERVSKEAHAKAKAALREHYQIKAGLLGMTLAGYCQRFGVKL